MPEKKSKKRICGPRSRIAILFAVTALVVLIFPLRTQGQLGALGAGITGAATVGTSSGSVGGTATVSTPSDSKNLLDCGNGFSAQKFVSCLLYFVTMLIVAILKLFVSLGAWITKVGLVFSKGVINSPAVQTGFSVSLSIANLGFVLGIIVIALATILRRETYGIKQILWKLVFAAILVNFSLVIAGVILGISDQFTGYFMEATAGGDTLTFVNSLASSFNPQALSRPPSTDSTTGPITFTRALLAGATFGGSEIYTLINNQLGGDGKFWSDLVQQLLNMVFVAVFLAIIALTFIALGIMLMIRYVYIGVLLVLAPLAWLAWIFPQFSSNFSKWWQQFLRWAFFPMFVTFFLYLAMTTAINKDTYIDPKLMPTGNGPELSVAAQIGNSEILQNAGQMMIILGFALGGIFAANAMSIKGANVAMGAMRSVGTMAAGYAGRKTKNQYERVRTMGRQYNPQTKETTTALQRLGSRMQGVPGLRKAGAAVAKHGAPESPKRLEDIEKYRKENLEALDAGGVITRANSATAFVNPVIAAAIGQELARRNLTDKIDPAKLDKYLNVTEKMGNSQAILNSRPELAAKTSAATPREMIDPVTGVKRLETVTEAQTRAIVDAIRKIRVSDATQLNYKSIGEYNPALTRALTNNELERFIPVALNLSNAQLGRLGTEGSAEQIEAFRNTVVETRNRYMLNQITLNQQQIDAVDRIEDYLKNSPNWQAI